MVIECVAVGGLAFISGAYIGAALIMDRLHKRVTGDPLSQEKWFATLEALLKKSPD